jgi:hypothetical protein
VRTTFSCDKHDIKLLVSTSSNILYLDLSEHYGEVFYGGTYAKEAPSFYGITWNHSNIFIVDSPFDFILARSNLIALNKKGSLECCIDSPEGSLLDVHQMQYFNGLLYVVDTGHNAIRILDLETYEWYTFYPDSFNRDIDTHHFNSVYVDCDRVVIVAHNIEGVSNVLEYDHDFHFLHSWEIGSGAHNLAYIDHRFLSCDSRSGQLVWETGETLRKFLGWFCRGLSVLEDSIIVGKSEPSPREWRMDKDARVHLIDPTTGSDMGQILLDKVGQIFEIRCLNQWDKAHPVPPIWWGTNE